MTEINLGWAIAWRAAAGGVLLAGGGLALCVAAVAGLPGRDPSQRALAVLFGLALLAVGVLVLVAVRRSSLRLRIDRSGFSIEHRTLGGFTVHWDELTDVRLLRERRRVGRARMWHYSLELATVRELPDLALWREGAGYRYELGTLGFAGRRMDRALAEHGSVRYRGLALT